MVKTLLTTSEVLTLAKANSKIPKCSLDDIHQIEYRERRTCLGKAFYDSLLEDLIDHSGAEEYQSGQIYAADDVVLFEGIYYKAKAETSALPSKKSDWEVAPKFNTEANNELWCRFLGIYLARLVIRNSISALSTQLTAAGTVKIDGETFEAAKEDEVVRLQKWINSQVAIAKANLNDYLNENASIFSSYAGIKEDPTCTDDPDDPDCNKHTANGYLIG